MTDDERYVVWHTLALGNVGSPGILHQDTHDESSTQRHLDAACFVAGVRSVLRDFQSACLPLYDCPPDIFRSTANFRPLLYPNPLRALLRVQANPFCPQLDDNATFHRSVVRSLAAKVHRLPGFFPTTSHSAVC